MNIKLKRIYFDCKPIFKINDVKMSISTYDNMFEVQILSQGFSVNHRVHTFLYIFVFNNSTFYL